VPEATNTVGMQNVSLHSKLGNGLIESREDQFVGNTSTFCVK